jgi:hypothetical protein
MLTLLLSLLPLLYITTTPQLTEAEQRKAALQDQVTDCSNKLRRAEQLISGLGGEKAAWGRFSTDLLEKVPKQQHIADQTTVLGYSTIA